MADCLYQRDGNHFLPTAFAGSPWNPKAQHGGPVCGLMAYCAEALFPDPHLHPTRLTVDLFRAVPKAPVEPRARILRQGRRIGLAEVSLHADEGEVARATALFLRRTNSSGIPPVDSGHRGPEGLETTELVPGAVKVHIPEGFHTHLEVRWETRPDADKPAFWLRAPARLVEGENWTPFQRAAAISDLGNALASARIRTQGEAAMTFINTDSTLYLSRLPVGDWIRLSCDHLEDRDGIGLVSVVHHDECGRFGRTVQARLANPSRHSA